MFVRVTSHRSALGRLFAASGRYFLWVFAAGFILGMVRVPLVVPHLGTRWAELAEMPLMLVVIWWAAGWLLDRYRIKPLRFFVGCGLVALLLMLIAEAVLALVIGQQSLVEYLRGRDPVSGGVYAIMLLVYAALPALLAARRPLRSAP